VPVIFIMLILATLVVGFELSASRELRSAANFSAQSQRFYAARGALYYAASALAQTSANGATYGVVPAGPDTDSNGWMQVGDGWVKIDVIDTAGLINLNTVDQPTLQRLPVFRDNPDVTAAMIDWRTPETQALQNGAKSDYYNSLNPPYDCKDKPYDSVDELLLVKGMTPTLFFGNASGGTADVDAANSASSGSTPLPGLGGVGGGTRAATRQAAGTPAPAGGAGGGAAGGAAAAGDTDWTDIYSNSNIPLSELFTVAGRERNVAADGTLRVNINTATSQDLQDKLGIDATLADGLVRFRSSGTGAAAGAPGAPGGGPGAGNGAAGGARPSAPAARPSRQAPMPGGGGAAGQGGGAAGGPGAGGGGGAAANQVFKTIGDLMNVPGRETFDRTTMQKIADHISVDDQPYHDSLININTASQEVLATVPGMDHATLQAIIDFRQGGQAFQSLGDLFGISSLTRQQYINVIGHLCTKSSIYRVRIRVAMPGQQSIYAISALVEMTDYGPRIRQWREVSRDPGWASWVTTQQLPTPTPPAATGNTGTPVTTGNTS
jgi:type II secretory pathway component PulK